MVWDVAAGVIIGGIVLGLLRWAGESDPELADEVKRTGERERIYIALAIRAAIASVGVALSIWIIGFKAHL